MRQTLFALFFLLLITASCSPNSDSIGPDDLLRTQGSDLLELKAVYTTVESDGTSQTIHRTLTHTFDQDCRLTERRDEYSQGGYPLNTERFMYVYNNAGLLTTQKQYESFNSQPEQLAEQITYEYDTQSRLISQKYQNTYMTNWRFEYIDAKKQVNRYACSHSDGNCLLSSTTVDGKRTYPDSSYGINGYVSSTFTPYGNMLYETIDAKGNRMLAEVYQGYEKKTLLQKTVWVYDAQPAIPLQINEADFKGYPADDQFRPGNNPVQSDHYTYDPATGAVREHLRVSSQFTYNQLGYPTQVKTEETDILTGKPTGIRSVITVRYGCGK